MDAVVVPVAVSFSKCCKNYSSSTSQAHRSTPNSSRHADVANNLAKTSAEESKPPAPPHLTSKAGRGRSSLPVCQNYMGPDIFQMATGKMQEGFPVSSLHRNQRR
eukprot:1804685-Amphidinium_carterae.2